MDSALLKYFLTKLPYKESAIRYLYKAYPKRITELAQIDDLIEAREVAKLLNVDWMYVHKLAAEGKIPAYKISSYKKRSGKWLFSKSEIEEFIKPSIHGNSCKFRENALLLIAESLVPAGTILNRIIFDHATTQQIADEKKISVQSVRNQSYKELLQVADRIKRVDDVFCLNKKLLLKSRTEKKSFNISKTILVSDLDVSVRLKNILLSKGFYTVEEVAEKYKSNPSYFEKLQNMGDRTLMELRVLIEANNLNKKFVYQRKELVQELEKTF